MKSKILLPLTIVAATISAQSLCATTLTFTGNITNNELPATYGSDNTTNDTEFVTSDGSGATENIGLTWAPVNTVSTTGFNSWEFHNHTVFSAIGTSVAQLDNNSDPANPLSTITFTPDAGFAMVLNSLRIGHATDMTAPAYAWTLTVERTSDDVVVDTKTTAVMAAGDAETVNFNFTGDLGVEYRLVFDDGGAQTFNGGISALSFSQAVPEPSSTALLGLGGLALILRRRK
jgi:hypothetical protein